MNKTEVVVDTNVLFVANGKTEQASPECRDACIQELKQVQSECRTLLDEMGLILQEYRKSLDGAGQIELGTAFFYWLWDNQSTLRNCRKVPISVHADRKFVEFPDDPRLAQFDYDDRKFVAVARASGTNPQLLNASDTDWWHDRQALVENGVDVVFLCPELMKRER